MRALSFSVFTLIATTGGLVACGDPAYSDRISALGGEAAGVRPGPNHRPGQPCLACHGGSGPGPEFSAAGTIFLKDGDLAPAENVVVTLKDANGRVASRATNNAGNFYIGKSSGLVYPITVKIARDGKEVPMNTWLNGSSGCADCHNGQTGPRGMARVYLTQ
jgi:hypothetical protein